MNMQSFSRLVPLSVAFSLATMLVPALTARTLAAPDATAIEESLSQSIVTSSNTPAQQTFNTIVDGIGPASGQLKTTTVTPASPPIPLTARDFVYRGDSSIVETKPGQQTINELYFKSCLGSSYSVLGTNNPPIVKAPTRNQPIVGVVASDISPNLTAEQIARLQSVNVNIRFAFVGNSQGARMRLALRNVNTNEVLQFGDFRVTGGTCQTFSKNLVSGFRKPGVYRLEVRLVNKVFPLDPANPKSPLLRKIAVAGFDNTAISVSLK